MAAVHFTEPLQALQFVSTTDNLRLEFCPSALFPYQTEDGLSVQTNADRGINSNCKISKLHKISAQEEAGTRTT